MVWEWERLTEYIERILHIMYFDCCALLVRMRMLLFVFLFLCDDCCLDEFVGDGENLIDANFKSDSADSELLAIFIFQISFIPINSRCPPPQVFLSYYTSPGSYIAPFALQQT